MFATNCPPYNLIYVHVYFILLFQVQSSSSEHHYIVNINGPSVTCECRYQMKTELPCKHIFALLQHTHVVWEDLPHEYRYLSLLHQFILQFS